MKCSVHLTYEMNDKGLAVASERIGSERRDNAISCASFAGHNLHYVAAWFEHEGADRMPPERTVGSLLQKCAYWWSKLRIRKSLVCKVISAIICSAAKAMDFQ